MANTYRIFKQVFFMPTSCDSIQKACLNRVGQAFGCMKVGVMVVDLLLRKWFRFAIKGQ